MNLEHDINLGNTLCLDISSSNCMTICTSETLGPTASDLDANLGTSSIIIPTQYHLPKMIVPDVNLNDEQKDNLQKMTFVRILEAYKQITLSGGSHLHLSLLVHLGSEVGILKRVLEEVEKVMNEFRGMLYKSMEDPLLDLAELENTVRLLLELEHDSDPVWHYLHIQNRKVRGLLEKCTMEHEGRMEVLHNEMQERVQSDARWRQLQQESNKSMLILHSGTPEILRQSISLGKKLML